MPARGKTLNLRATLILCALSGALLAACFPALGLWPLAWMALVPWLVALRLTGAGAALLGSSLGGFVFYGILLYWLALFGWTVWALSCIVLSFSLLAWGLAARWIGRLGASARIFGVAVLWCGLEWARGLGQFGFTWGWLGYSQSPALELLPVARLAGTLGLSFLIVLVNAALAELVVSFAHEGRPFRPALRTAAILALAALAFLGARKWMARQGDLQGPGLRVAIVQGSAHGPLRAENVNVPLTREEMQRARDAYQTLTAKATGARPSLVVWPESVLTGAPERDPPVAEWVARVTRASGAWLLAGGPYYDEAGRQFNSAYLYAPSGNLVARYDKVQLVPFGEYVPGRERLPFLDHYNVRDTDFSPGAVHRLLQAGTVSLGPMICFESIFPQISWDLVRKDAQVLVIITNDAWFGHTAAAAQHRQIAALRAVETNRWIIRAASTGSSCFIAPDGRIVSQTGLFEKAVLSQEIRLAAEKSGAESPGLLFAWVMLFLSTAYLIAPTALPRRRRKAGAARPSARPRPPGRATPR